MSQLVSDITLDTVLEECRACGDWNLKTRLGIYIKTNDAIIRSKISHKKAMLIQQKLNLAEMLYEGILRAESGN